MKVFKLKKWICTVILYGTCMPCFGTENGVSAYPLGLQTVMTGLQPAPHTSDLYLSSTLYTSGEVDGHDGHPISTDLNITVRCLSGNFSYNWGKRLAGGMLVSQVAVPFLSEALRTPGGGVNKNGLANIFVVPMNVSYNTEYVHWYYEVGYSAPSLDFNPQSSLNVGQHYQSVLPAAGVTILTAGARNEVSSRLGYSINSKNPSNGYRSGQELIWEFNADHRLRRSGVMLGVNGAFYLQTTDDRQNGTKVLNGNRGRTLLLGPQAHIPITKHLDIVCKYYRESLVMNRTRGNVFWLETMIPFPSPRHRR